MIGIRVWFRWYGRGKVCKVGGVGKREFGWDYGDGSVGGVCCEALMEY